MKPRLKCHYKLNTKKQKWKNFQFLTDRGQLGLVVQEVEQIYPEVVYTDKDGMKSIVYSQLIGHIIEAIKELKEENEAIKKELAKLKTTRGEIN